MRDDRPFGALWTSLRDFQGLRCAPPHSHQVKDCRPERPVLTAQADRPGSKPTKTSPTPKGSFKRTPPMDGPFRAKSALASRNPGLRPGLTEPAFQPGNP